MNLSGDEISFVTLPQSGDHRQPFPKPHIEAFETPLRTDMALDYLEKAGALDGVDRLDAMEATLEDALHVHSAYLVDAVSIMSDLGSGFLGEASYASPDLLLSSLFALGGALEASKQVVSGDARHAFALVRPPGHHASTSNPGGLCYFNNVAIAVKQALSKKHINRVSILDFDNHFGNGTAEIFYTDASVQCLSIHEYNYESFGIGHYEEVGHGEGRGTNINIPLLESSHDDSYNSAMENIVKPAIQSFEPDLIAVSAGYDPHFADPVGNMDVDSRTFWMIGKSIQELVSKLGVKGSFWVLEGGYNLFTLGPSIHGSLEGLRGNSKPSLWDQVDRHVHEELLSDNLEIIEKVLETISRSL